MSSEENGQGTRPSLSPKSDECDPNELGKALQAINRFFAVREPVRGQSVSQKEFDEIRTTEKEQLNLLRSINDPLVQAIAYKLTTDRYSRDARGLINKLCDRVGSQYR